MTFLVINHKLCYLSLLNITDDFLVVLHLYFYFYVLIFHIFLIQHYKSAFHRCTFSFITAHFVHHCTLKQALDYKSSEPFKTLVMLRYLLGLKQALASLCYFHFFSHFSICQYQLGAQVKSFFPISFFKPTNVQFLYGNLLINSRGVQYVHWVMNKCITVKVGGKRNTHKVCKKQVKFSKTGGKFLKVGEIIIFVKQGEIY